MPQSVDDLARFLVGEWRLRRRLVSLEPVMSGTAEGMACFEPRPEGLAYYEAVDVDYADHEGPATRAYRYHLSQPWCARVHFEDGRFFHAFDLRDGRWRAEHRCGDDVYLGGFRVLRAGLWIARWRVFGPRKDLRISTLYERQY